MGDTKLTAFVATKAWQALNENVEDVGLRRDTFLGKFIEYWMSMQTKADLRGSPENIRVWKAASSLQKDTYSKVRISIDCELLERFNFFCKERNIYRDAAITAILWDASARARLIYQFLYDDDAWPYIGNDKDAAESLAACALDSETAQIVGHTLSDINSHVSQKRMDELKAKKGLNHEGS